MKRELRCGVFLIVQESFFCITISLPYNKGSILLNSKACFCIKSQFQFLLHHKFFETEFL